MKYRHFGKKNQKQALLRGLVLSMFKNGSIKTYPARAKDAQRLIDKIVNLGIKSNMNTKRRISQLLSADRDIVSAIEKIAQNFKERNSGHTRIVRLGQRRGDSAEMVSLEWVTAVKSTKGAKATVSKSEENKKEENKEENINVTA